MDNNNISRDAQWRIALREQAAAKERTARTRVKMPALDPKYRVEHRL